MTIARQAVVVCAPGRGSPLREVGGLTLVERLMRQLCALDGIEELVLVGGPLASLPNPSTRISIATRTVRSAESDAWRMIQDVGELLSERFLVVAGDLVVDQRILFWLANQESNTLIKPAPQASPEMLGTLDREALRALSSGATAGVFEIPVGSFPVYWREQRGEVPVHLVRVSGEREARQAWAILLDHVEKRAKDLPAVLFDPPVENFLVRVLAPRPITPNQVTFATTCLGFLVAWLFWNGWLQLGIVLAIVVEVLDGVDGKLARLKYMTSRVGEFEHVLDFFYEMAWYLALGNHLAARGSPWAWKAALALCAFDLADNLAYLFLARLRGQNLDETSPFLRRFRLIAGRRNIYAWLLLPGILLGTPQISFAVVSTWGGITASLHWLLAVRKWREPIPTEVEKIAPRAPTAATTAKTRRH